MNNRELTDSELNGIAAGHHHHHEDHPKAPSQNEEGAPGKTKTFTWDIQANKEV